MLFSKINTILYTLVCRNGLTKESYYISEISEQNGTTVGKPQLPEISLEWSDLRVTFRIVSDSDFENNTDLQKQHYEIFPKLDSSAPSARSIPYLKKKANKEKNNGTTLSSFLGHPVPQSSTPVTQVHYSS